MHSVYFTWQRIVEAEANGEWLGTDSEGYTFARRDQNYFDALVPAAAIYDVFVYQKNIDDIEERTGVHIVVAAGEDRPHLYNHPGIDVLVFPEEKVVLGPLSVSGLRSEVYAGFEFV